MIISFALFLLLLRASRLKHLARTTFPALLLLWQWFVAHGEAVRDLSAG
jgi:hypothetical protein